MPDLPPDPAARLAALRPLLACPACHGPLADAGPDLACPRCAVTYPVRHGRPTFLPGGADPKLMPAGHDSNQPPDQVMEWLTWQRGWVLNLGAGGTAVKLDHVVELEYSLFRHTDVAADAHNLPFADACFDAVVTFNTFEHLADPDRAAAELFRVLKPGGRLFLHTAFLQPVHEPPHHYYNTTEYGLRRWFRAFDIADVTVSDNFHPGHVFAWLAATALYHADAHLGPDAKRALAAMTLADWAKFWTDPAARTGELWKALGRLPQDAQKQFAAGFQLTAARPPASAAE